MITKPTRVTESTASLIDNIFTNMWNKIIGSSIIISDISDHLPTLATFDYNLVTPPHSISQTRRSFTPAATDSFLASLSQQDWTQTLSACRDSDADKAYNLFIDNYAREYDRAFPLKKINQNKRALPKKPWMTPGLLKLCATKSKLQLKFVKHPTEANKINYNRYRNNFKKLDF